MKFTIDIPDEDLIATSAAVGLPFGSDNPPTPEAATEAIQQYFDKPYNQVKRDKVKKEDPEVLAQEAKVKQEADTYADLVAQKSGTPKEDLVDNAATLSIQP